VHHAPVGFRNVRHAAPIAVAGAHLLGKAGEIEPVLREEVHAGRAVEARRVVVRRVRREEFGGGHPHRRAGLRHQPRRAAHMVGVVVRDDDVLHRPPADHAGEMLLPEVPGRLRAEAGVDEREAVGDMDRFSGLGDALVERMNDYLVVKTHSPFHATPGGLVRKCSIRFK
jgi:hypothetical protein